MELKKGINLHLINTNKFKTNLIAIFLSTPLTRENVTKDAVLSAILRRGCQEIKTQEEISKKLEEMYGAEFDCGLDKIGKNHVLKFYIESVNDEFLPKEEGNILQQSIKILTEIVFNPLIENEQFNEEYMSQEKENIKQIIEAKKDNKARYALFRCVEEMYKDMPEGLYKFGYVEDLNNINAKNLYEYYKKLINECKIDIFISGKIDEKNAENFILENENIKKLQERAAIYNVNKIEKKQLVEKENQVEESMDVTQGKLVIGYDVAVDEETKDDKNLRYIGMMYNAILGGTATSKLFQNVREKASLAYTTNSSYSYYTNNIFVAAGIEIDNFQKALDIIKQQIEDMKNGDFSNEDIENAKKVLKSSIASINDEQDTEIIYFLGQALSGNNISLDEYAELVDNVTKEQINDFAQKVKINTIYFLKN